MRRMLGWTAGLLLAALVLSAGMSGRADEKTPTPEPPATSTVIDETLFATLRVVINRGAEIYNRGDYAECYRLYEGALMTARPLLNHRPDLQKAIADGIISADRDAVVWRRAFVLRNVIDKVRADLKAAPGKFPPPMPKEKDKDKEGPFIKEKKGPSPVEVRIEALKLEGKWVVVSAEVEGKSLDDDKGSTFTFDDGKLVLRRGEAPPLVGLFELDPSKSPKWIDVSTPKGKLVVRAIYRFDGDKLELCTSRLEKVLVDGKEVERISDRPTRFDSKQGILYVLERDKKKEKGPGKDKEKEPGKDKEKEKGKDDPAVRGVVTIKGKPLTTGVVTFHGEKGFPRAATVAADGSYKVDDLPLGKYRVTVTLPPDGVEDKGKKGVPAPRDLIPAKYTSVKTTPLVVEVADRPATFVLDLE